MINITFSIHTLGCKVNSYESNVIIESCQKKGFKLVPFGSKCNVSIINTCAVTEESARKSKQFMRRAKKINPECIVVMAGCLSQIEKDFIPEADIIIGTKNKTQIADFITDFLNQKSKLIEVSDIENQQIFETMLTEHNENTRATVKIQDGCNNFCSYCIIPYARGRIRSKPIDIAINEISALAAKGYREIVLTGIHLDSYGKEGGEFDLCDILEKIDEISGLQRIRLGSLEPVFMTDEHIERLKKIKKLCPQFHLSLQSGCDETLKRMNRHYTAKNFKRAVEKIRENFFNAAITTDVIVGFCGETEEEFNKSLSFVKSINFAKIHVFPYSERKGTKAYEMSDKISKETKTQRAKTMIAAAEESENAFRENLVGKTSSVLIEKIEKDLCYGYTDNYIKTVFKDDHFQINDIISAKIEKVCNNICFGSVIKK